MSKGALDARTPPVPVLSQSKRQPQPTTRSLCTLRPSSGTAPLARARVGALHSLRFARNGTKPTKLTHAPPRVRARLHAHVAANFANFRRLGIRLQRRHYEHS